MPTWRIGLHYVPKSFDLAEKVKLALGASPSNKRRIGWSLQARDFTWPDATGTVEQLVLAQTSAAASRRMEGRDGQPGSACENRRRPGRARSAMSSRLAERVTA
jgi:hypothetical protein